MSLRFGCARWQLILWEIFSHQQQWQSLLYVPSNSKTASISLNTHLTLEILQIIFFYTEKPWNGFVSSDWKPYMYFPNFTYLDFAIIANYFYTVIVTNQYKIWIEIQIAFRNLQCRCSHWVAHLRYVSETLERSRHLKRRFHLTYLYWD